MPLGPDALITWEYAKAKLNLQDSAQAETEDFINSISMRANQIANRLLAQRTKTIFPHGTGSERLLLPQHPVASITHLYIDEDRVFGTDTEILEKDYFLDGDAGILYLHSGRFPRGVAVVKIVDFVAGYDPIPDDLQLAVLQCLDVTRRRLSAGMVGVRSMAAGGQITASYELSIPMDAAAVFESYRELRA